MREDTDFITTGQVNCVSHVLSKAEELLCIYMRRLFTYYTSYKFIKISERISPQSVKALIFLTSHLSLIFLLCLGGICTRLPLESNYISFVPHLALLNISSPWVGSVADSRPRIVFPKPESCMPQAKVIHVYRVQYKGCVRLFLLCIRRPDRQAKVVLHECGNS